MDTSRIIVISQPWGGLGDNLQFSTLPKLYSDQGYEIYISKDNAYRNKEIYDLVWKWNPYVKGETDLPPNAGACRGLEYHHEGQFIKNIELTHRLDKGNSPYPVVYYTPKKIEELSNTVIYDTTSISSSYSDEFIYSNFNTIMEQYKGYNLKQIKFSNISNRVTPDFHTEEITVNNIFEYCDIIYSCKVLICVMSGSSVLASAIKNTNTTPDIHCFHTRHERGFMFDNITYHIK